MQIYVLSAASKEGFLGGSMVEYTYQFRRHGSNRSLGWEDPLEEEMATHSSSLAWRITWTEDPGGLQFMGSQKSQTGLSNYRTTTKLPEKAPVRKF